MKTYAKRLGSGLLLAGWMGATAMAPAMAKSAKATTSSSTSAPTKMIKAGKSTKMTGTIISMTETSLTLKPSRKAMGDEKTVDVPSGARIMIGKQPAALTNLQVGEKVTVRMNAEGQVTSILAKALPKVKNTATQKKM